MLMNKDVLAVLYVSKFVCFGPDVLRVKPVEGWKRGKAFVFYPERCISDGACLGVCPTHAIFWMRPMEWTHQEYLFLYTRTVYSTRDGKKAKQIFHNTSFF